MMKKKNGKGVMAEENERWKKNIADDLRDQSVTLGSEDSAEQNSSNKIEQSSAKNKGAAVGEDKEEGSKTPWKDLFKGASNRKLGNSFKLSYRDTEGDEAIVLPEDIIKVEEAWGHALVGYVAGRSPGKHAIMQCCNSWKVEYKTYFDPSGWVVMKFENEEDRDVVLANGPYVIYGRPFLIKIMPPLFCFDENEISKVPVWVRFPRLPRELWTEGALSTIASRVGVPIQSDSLTVTRERCSFARVLIEVDLSKELKKEVKIKLPFTTMVQRVEYEYVPMFCNVCKKLGHDEAKCEKITKIEAKGTPEKQKARVEEPRPEGVAPKSNKGAVIDTKSPVGEETSLENVGITTDPGKGAKNNAETPSCEFGETSCEEMVKPAGKEDPEKQKARVVVPKLVGVAPKALDPTTSALGSSKMVIEKEQDGNEGNNMGAARGKEEFKTVRHKSRQGKFSGRWINSYTYVND